MTMLEMTEDLLLDDLFPDEDAILKETWPIPAEEMSREYEQYLIDIGVRI